MKIKFLGKHNGTAAMNGFPNNNAYFIHKNNLVFIDCGYTNAKKVSNIIQKYPDKNIYILITHAGHVDHTGGLAPVIPFVKGVLRRNITIISDDSKRITSILNNFSIRESRYTICSLKQFNSIPNGIYLKSYIQDHDVDLKDKCFAFLITLDGTYNIYYSGDGKLLFEDILQMFRNGKIQEFYQDVSSEKSWTHIGLAELEKEFSFKERRFIHLMHFTGRRLEESCLKKGFSSVTVEKNF